MDLIVRPKQVIYGPNFVTRIRWTQNYYLKFNEHHFNNNTASTPGLVVIMSRLNILELCSAHRQSLHPEDGGSKVLQNAGILLQHYTASQPKRLRFECSDISSTMFIPPSLGFQCLVLKVVSTVQI